MTKYYIVICTVLCLNLYVHDSYEEWLPNLKILETKSIINTKLKQRMEQTNVWRGIKKQNLRRSIVSNMDVEDMKIELSKIEMSILRQLEEVQRNKERQRLKEYVEIILPQLCRYIYSSDKFEINMDLKTIHISLRKTHLLKNDKFIPLLDDNMQNQNIPQIFLGRDIIAKFRRENSICIARMLFDGDYFKSLQKVHGVKLYMAENDATSLDATNMQDFTVLVDLPVTKINNSPKCSMLLNNAWDPSKCITLSLSQTVIKCGCKALGYYTILSVESSTLGPIFKSSAVSQQSVPTTTHLTTMSTVLTAVVTNKLVKSTAGYEAVKTGTTVRPKLTIEQVDMQGSTVTTATVALSTLIVVLSICIVSIISAWVYIYIRSKKRNSVIDNSVTYGRYYDEHTLDSIPE